ncbi:FAD-dependent thymidylate synthase, partial [Rickettsiales bacterium]|nr:FAD-dependent thymidylate synthase [Rickettsiales bacterium]
FSTKRVTVKRVENILYKKFKVLDQGFVRVIDYMGDDSSIVQAARVSYGKGTKKINQDRNLINYLLSHRHSTPFEMNEIKLHIKLPIFIARQWIRHRTANVNEYSARYSILEREFYMPSLQNLKTQSKTNNQGRGEKIERNEAKEKLNLIKKNSEQAFDNYSFLLNEDINGNIIDHEKDGIARELARMTLPLNTYTQWYWKIDLHNLMHFLSLRFDTHAQYEIRVYADRILDILKRWVPLTYDAFINYRMEGFSLSSEGVNFLKSIIKNEKFDKKKISQREIDEIKKKFNLEL